MGISSCHNPEPKIKVKYNKTSPRAVSESAEDSIINLIVNLKEVKQKNSEIEKLSNGKRHLSIYIENRPTSADPYYWVKVAEDNGGNYVASYIFAIDNKTHAINYYDSVQDTVISLDQWRKLNATDEPY